MVHTFLIALTECAYSRREEWGSTSAVLSASDELGVWA